jgi:hypothetical protein
MPAALGGHVSLQTAHSRPKRRAWHPTAGMAPGAIDLTDLAEYRNRYNGTVFV